MTIRLAGLAFSFMVAAILALHLRNAAMMAELKAGERKHIADWNWAITYAEHLKKDVLPKAREKDEIEDIETDLAAAVQSAKFHQRQAASCAQKIRALSRSTILRAPW
jgi:hypothetical protein